MPDFHNISHISEYSKTAIQNSCDVSFNVDKYFRKDRSDGITEITYTIKSTTLGNMANFCFPGLIALMSESDLWKNEKRKYFHTANGSLLGHTKNQTSDAAYDIAVRACREGKLEEACQWFTNAYNICESNYCNKEKYKSCKTAALEEASAVALFKSSDFNGCVNKLGTISFSSLSSEQRTVIANLKQSASFAHEASRCFLDGDFSLVVSLLESSQQQTNMSDVREVLKKHVQVASEVASAIALFKSSDFNGCVNKLGNISLSSLSSEQRTVIVNLKQSATLAHEASRCFLDGDFSSVVSLLESSQQVTNVSDVKDVLRKHGQVASVVASAVALLKSSNFSECVNQLETISTSSLASEQRTLILELKKSATLAQRANQCFLNEDYSLAALMFESSQQQMNVRDLKDVIRKYAQVALDVASAVELFNSCDFSGCVVKLESFNISSLPSEKWTLIANLKLSATLAQEAFCSFLKGEFSSAVCLLMSSQQHTNVHDVNVMLKNTTEVASIAHNANIAMQEHNFNIALSLFEEARNTTQEAELREKLTKSINEIYTIQSNLNEMQAARELIKLGKFAESSAKYQEIIANCSAKLITDKCQFRSNVAAIADEALQLLRQGDFGAAILQLGNAGARITDVETQEILIKCSKAAELAADGLEFYGEGKYQESQCKFERVIEFLNVQ